ncbi:MAG: DUF177 domain-containing protein [Bacteroidales bacterium]|nr:DUF177 domain-containing protein [Bacteroidales bacterium]
MELNVSKELKAIGAVGRALICEMVGDIVLSGRVIRLEEPVTLDLAWTYDGKGIVLSGSLSSAVRMNCTKCNEEFVRAFTVEVSERFLKVSESEAEELDCYPYSGDVLSLDKPVRDLIVLNAPAYGLCRPSCRGLCPVCGANLNNTQCSCELPDDGNPFAVLKGLAGLLNDQEE